MNDDDGLPGGRQADPVANVRRDADGLRQYLPIVGALLLLPLMATPARDQVGGRRPRRGVPPAAACRAAAEAAAAVTVHTHLPARAVVVLRRDTSKRVLTPAQSQVL